MSRFGLLVALALLLFLLVGIIASLRDGPPAGPTVRSRGSEGAAPTSLRGDEHSERAKPSAAEQAVLCDLDGVILDEATRSPLADLELILFRDEDGFNAGPVIETDDAGRFQAKIVCGTRLPFIIAPEQGYVTVPGADPDGSWLARRALRVVLVIRDERDEPIKDAWLDPLGWREKVPVPAEGLDVQEELDWDQTPGRIGATGFATKPFFVREDGDVTQLADGRLRVVGRLERLPSRGRIEQWLQPATWAVLCLSSGSSVPCERQGDHWECLCSLPSTLGVATSDSAVGFTTAVSSWADPLPELPDTVEVCLSNDGEQTVPVRLAPPAAFGHDQRLGRRLRIPPGGRCIAVFDGASITILVGQPPWASTELVAAAGVLVDISAP